MVPFIGKTVERSICKTKQTGGSLRPGVGVGFVGTAGNRCVCDENALTPDRMVARAAQL